MLLRSVIALLSVALVATVLAYLHSIPFGPDDNVLHAYQDLCAGILALVGALAGTYFLQRQIDFQKEQEEARTRRRHDASRATMPMALMSIGDYAAKTIEILREARADELERAAMEEQAEGMVSYDFAIIDVPALQGAVLAEFKDMIEACDEHQAAPFASLLSSLQVQVARIRSLNADKKLPTFSDHMARAYELLDRMFDALYIYAAAGSLLQYARKHSPLEDGPSWNMIELSIWSLRLSEFQEFAEFVGRKKELSPVPRIVTGPTHVVR